MEGIIGGGQLWLKNALDMDDVTENKEFTNLLFDEIEYCIGDNDEKVVKLRSVVLEIARQDAPYLFLSND